MTDQLSRGRRRPRCFCGCGRRGVHRRDDRSICENTQEVKRPRGAGNARGRGTEGVTPMQSERTADAIKKCARPGCQNSLVKGSVYCSPRCHYDDRGRRGTRREQPYHRCRTCGRVFAWNGRGKGTFCGDPCAHRGNVRFDPEVVDVVTLRGFRRVDWNGVPLSRCSRCGTKRSSGNRLVRHHAVYEQHVLAAGGDRWDPANQVCLCTNCHGLHHGRSNDGSPMAVEQLPDAVFMFAEELLGAGAAYEYFRRYYSGEDPRLEALLSA